MRWSLILSLTVLSTLSVALVIPTESSIDLERRAGGAKTSSKTYRKNSKKHDYAYKFDKSGAVSREKLKPADRPANGEKMLMIPKTDADHVFEHQMLNNHLAKHNLHYDKLDPKLKAEVKAILNGPHNMAPVPARINRGKGQVIRHGLKGKALKPSKSRDQYTLLSYKTARKTAKNLDQAFKDHGHDFKDKTFHNTLRNTMDNAKIMKPGDPSPASSVHGSSRASSVHGSSRASSVHGSSRASSVHGSSRASSVHGSSRASSVHGSVKAPSPRKPIVVGSLSKKTKVLPTRSSARIANRRNGQGI